MIVGDPGSGKTTFLRRLAHRLSQSASPFPIYIRIAELTEHIQNCRTGPGRPTTAESPAWIPHFLQARNQEMRWGLGENFFEKKLDEGSCHLMLDGLDEAPSATERARMARLFENATQAYPKCRFVVTTRPLAYVGLGILDRFQTAHIEPLETDAVETFLQHWCAGLFPGSAEAAAGHLKELSEALKERAEIRRMASNPVMLTALAVVHWNERRLPEQRADLYESILTWLVRTREKRPGRESAERCLLLLQSLAAAMVDAPDGRQIQVSKGWAAEVLRSEFAQFPEAEQYRRAQAFLDQEEVDSGIVLSRGGEIRFWHLTFQEYLAARHMAGMTDAVQHALLLKEQKIYRPEWREVALLLAGVMRVRQGPARVDGLVQALLDDLGERPALADQARCAGLLGAMVRDLRPLDYQPSDPRFTTLLEAALGIFDKAKALAIEFPVRLAAAEALGQAGDPRLARENWIRMEGGEFWMGAQNTDPAGRNYDPEALGDETPVHRVFLREYEIAKYPVTVQEYKRFVDGEGYHDPRYWKAGGFGRTSQPMKWQDQVLYPNRPVVGVSWYEAAAYCAWASVRLLTEAEWERAARGTQGRKYPWGDEEPDATKANYLDNKPGYPTPVGLYPQGATPEGIVDMAGNVWEWVSDEYAEYGRDVSSGEENGLGRVCRGGSWDYDQWYLRTADRIRSGPKNRNSLIGFRCARDVFS
ncbi:MAG: SUMF1/EgtB/PvdO family nonheme iron enzyme [Bryobacteraceae bacterium]